MLEFGMGQVSLFAVARKGLLYLQASDHRAALIRIRAILLQLNSLELALHR
jgi:hypothetical protein